MCTPNRTSGTDNPGDERRNCRLRDYRATDRRVASASYGLSTTLRTIVSSLAAVRATVPRDGSVSCIAMPIGNDG